MLGRSNAVANLAVKDLERARAFYTGTLGLSRSTRRATSWSCCKSGDTMLNVYRSEYAGTNEATAVTWEVDDIDGRGRRAQGQGHLLRALRHARPRAATATSMSAKG